MEISEILKSHKRSPIVLALTFFFSTLILVSMIIFYLIDEKKAAVSREMRYWAQAFAIKLQGQLEKNIAVGRGIDAYISVTGSIAQADLEALAPQLLKSDLNIRNIAVAPDLVINAVYPLAGNETALGLDYKSSPKQRDEVMKAMRLNRIVLAGPLTLVQGIENQLIARIPVYNRNGSEWGLVAVVIDMAGLLKSADFEVLSEKYNLAIRKITEQLDQGTLLLGQGSLFKSGKQLHPIPVQGGEWQLAIEPKNGMLVPLRFYLNLWGVALCICLSISIAVYYYRKMLMQKQAHLIHLESVLAVDPLTKLTSRYKFNEFLTDLIDQCKLSNKRFTVLLIDLDHFKEINDSLGHFAGDQLLIEIAGRLKQTIQPNDILCRLGGDEFIIVLQDRSNALEVEKTALWLTERIGEKIQVAGKEISITTSMGAAVYPDDGECAEQLIQHADLAMFESKRAGRNTLYFFNMSQRREADRYVKLLGAIKSAIGSKQFQVYYQPIYDLNAEGFTGCEALCRWTKPDGEIVSPEEFIPVAEQSGLVSDLGVWVAKEVFNCYRDMKKEGVELKFAINRSAREFSSSHHSKQLVLLANRFEIPPQNITLEITESLFMSDHGMKLKNFHLLRKHGFNFSIDDFGTGYSALSYLRQFPVSSLKIDKSYIAELEQEQPTDALVKAIIQMANSLGISVVAEGVETKQQFEFLRQAGCDFIQGFLLARPMPKNVFSEFILDSGQVKDLKRR